MPPELGLSAISALVAILALGFTVTRGRKTDIVLLTDRLARLETKVDVFWKGVSFDAARLLHSPHPEFARRDELLEKFTAGQLTVAEARELGEMMTAILGQHGSNAGERMAASVVLRYLSTWYEDAGISG